MSISKDAEKIMLERFGRDSVISLATCVNNMPFVRSVDAFYDNGAFFVLTCALSGKMKQISENPNVAVSGEWFTARGRGENLGFFGKDENRKIAEKMRVVFGQWIYNGHTDLSDESTVILKIRLTDGVLFSHGTRYDIEF